MSMSFAELQERAGQTSEASGWHDQYHAAREAGYKFELDHVAAKLALIHSEVSEALEAVRVDTGDLTAVERYLTIGGRVAKIDGFPVELADVVIRVMDLAYLLGIPLDEVIEEKIRFNAGRRRLHGKNL